MQQGSVTARADAAARLALADVVPRLRAPLVWDGAAAQAHLPLCALSSKCATSALPAGVSRWQPSTLRLRARGRAKNTGHKG